MSTQFFTSETGRIAAQKSRAVRAANPREPYKRPSQAGLKRKRPPRKRRGCERTPEQEAAWRAVISARMGKRWADLRAEQIAAAQLIPVAPIRDVFIERRDLGQLTMQGVAKEMGWTRERWEADSRGGRNRIGDSTRVARALGIKPLPKDNRKPGGGEERFRDLIPRRDADRLVVILNMDPQDAGL